MFCVAAGPVPGALQGTTFLGNSSGERFLPEVNVREIHGFVFLCISAHPKSIPGSVEVSLGLWGLCSAATAGSPGGILALELENKKGLGWPPVGLRLLWLCPLWTSPRWLQGVCPKPRAGPGSDSCGSCGLWLQTWGIFTPQDTAAPWNTSRGCRKGCRKLLLRLVLPWNVGTALGLSLFWVIPGNAAAPALPVELRDGSSLDCSPAPTAAPGLPELLSVLFPPPGMCFLSEQSW